MTEVFVHGLGAVSPAGWGVAPLRAATVTTETLPTKPLARPGWDKLLWVRQVPPPAPKPPFLAHPRLRRSNLIAQYTVAAATEAIGADLARIQAREMRLGIIVCVMAGCVTYSRRFCEETFINPALASPLLFPETVFNAPASHLAAYFGATGASYTLVGDEGTFAQGLALAADWLLCERADACVVVGAEEMDWIVADAILRFQRTMIHSDGAGAIYLKRENVAGKIAELVNVTDSVPFTKTQPRRAAARRMKSQLAVETKGQPEGAGKELLCLGTQKNPRADSAELEAWKDWTGARLAPKESLGEAFSASAAWQCVLACDALRRGDFTAVNVSVVGTNQQAIGVRFAQAGSA